MKRIIRPLYAPTFDDPFPHRPLTYNEECAATGGRSYALAPRVVPQPPEPEDETPPRKVRRGAT